MSGFMCPCGDVFPDAASFHEHYVTIEIEARGGVLPLDVERLGLAIGSVSLYVAADADEQPQRLALDTEALERIAAEYARLGEER